jgi:hypothetical protein
MVIARRRNSGIRRRMNDHVDPLEAQDPLLRPRVTADDAAHVRHHRRAEDLPALGADAAIPAASRTLRCR